MHRGRSEKQDATELLWLRVFGTNSVQLKARFRKKESASEAQQSIPLTSFAAILRRCADTVCAMQHDQQDAPLSQPLAQGAAVVALIGNHNVC